MISLQEQRDWQRKMELEDREFRQQLAERERQWRKEDAEQVQAWRLEDRAWQKSVEESVERRHRWVYILTGLAVFVTIVGSVIQAGLLKIPWLDQKSN